MHTIVVADRSLEHLRHIEALLARYRLASLPASSAEEAVGLVLAHHPDGVLIDAFMPEMAGFHAVRRLARDPRSAPIPVLMMAAPADQGHKVRALWHGARDLLVKPLTAAQLEATLLPLLDPAVPPPGRHRSPMCAARAPRRGPGGAPGGEGVAEPGRPEGARPAWTDGSAPTAVDW